MLLHYFIILKIYKFPDIENHDVDEFCFVVIIVSWSGVNMFTPKSSQAIGATLVTVYLLKRPCMTSMTTRLMDTWEDLIWTGPSHGGWQLQ